MKTRYRLLTLALAAVTLVPATAFAATERFQCGMTHYVRAGGAELVSTGISIRNADSNFAATVLRLTIRDGEGNVVHDSGPAIGVPLPLNTDFPNTFPNGKNVTVVPPGGMVYLRSNHIWGNNGLPSGAAGNELGQSLSASIEVAKEGLKSALSVGVTPRMRTRVAGSTPGAFVETDTRASSSASCEAIP